MDYDKLEQPTRAQRVDARVRSMCHDAEYADISAMLVRAVAELEVTVEDLSAEVDRLKSERSESAEGGE